jgi:hypothetical protein
MAVAAIRHQQIHLKAQTAEMAILMALLLEMAAAVAALRQSVKPPLLLEPEGMAAVEPHRPLVVAA